MDKRIALVTGANRGIGYETARQLARKGLHVVLTSRDESKGKTALNNLLAEGLDLSYHQLDVTDPKSIHRLYQFLESSFGRLDSLINNAGIFVDRDKTIFSLDFPSLQQTMEANVYGPLRLSQALLPLMKVNNYGRIVNVSSGLGQLSTMGQDGPAYRLSKAALNAISAMMAAELHNENILVNTMTPGWVASDMGGASAPRSTQQGADTVVWLATLEDDGPRGKFFKDREEIPW